MGYYTTFKFKAKLSKDAPWEILNKLVYDHNSLWPNGKSPDAYQVNERPDLPIDHPFGKTPRWPQMFNNASIKDSILEIETELKNYDEEIQKFIAWIKPFVVGRKQKTYLGSWQGEDMKEPINIYR